MSKVEVISYRDSSGYTQTAVFVDGLPAEAGHDVTVVDLDDGAGWRLSDWRWSVHANAEGLSPAAAELVRRMGEAMEGSEYIENDITEDEAPTWACVTEAHEECPTPATCMCACHAAEAGQ